MLGYLKYEITFGETTHFVYCDVVYLSGDNVVFERNGKIINIYHKPTSVRKVE